MDDSENYEKAKATDGEDFKHNNPIFHHIELLLFEALQLDVKNEVESLITEHLQSQNPLADAKAQNTLADAKAQNPLADAKAQKSPTSLHAHPHPLATLIAPFVETALREQAPLIVADILRQQNSLRR